jgi:hypothetical protein
VAAYRARLLDRADDAPLAFIGAEMRLALKAAVVVALALPFALVIAVV